jgi:glucose/arabinose dehydrogenase
MLRAGAVVLLLCLGPLWPVQGVPTGFFNDLMINNLPTVISVHFLPDTRMLIVRRTGEIRICPFMTRGDGTAVSTVYLTLPSVNSDSERGLLSLAVDPDFQRDPFIYLYYTHKASNRNRISRFNHVGNTADLGSEFILWEDPTLANNCCHHGGSLVFGSDGKIYLVRRLGE